MVLYLLYYIRLSFVIELVSKKQGYRDPQKPPEHTIVQEAEAFSSFTFAVATEALDQYERDPGPWRLAKYFS